MTDLTADVIVIGGGFAGVTAARELTRNGHTVTVLEARDRLGGRVWTDERLGFRVELGGTWVHWIQPHVWAEMTRYGVGIIASPEPEKVGWVGSEPMSWMTQDEFIERLDPGQRAFTADARDVFPEPHTPFAEEERVADLDGQTMADRLDGLGLDEEEYLLNHMMWSMHFNNPCDKGALTHGLRWTALAGWDWERLLEAAAVYKPEGGMSALVERIAADSTADIELEVVVRSVTDTGDGTVEVDTEDGRRFRASAAVVAVPVNTLPAIEFTPALPPTVQALADEGHIARGFKLWIRVKGRYEPLLALAAAPKSPLTMIQAEYWDDDATVFVAFGLEDGSLDTEDLRAVEAALRIFLPDAEVEDVAGHRWATDPYANGTWAMYKPNQLTRSLRDARAPRGRVVLSGSDLASGWVGFVDGAIESGHRAAREVSSVLD